MNLQSRLAILAALIVVIILFYKRGGILLRKLGLQGHPLKIDDPPIRVEDAALAKSMVQISADRGGKRADPATFLTEGTSITPIPRTMATVKHSVLSGDEDLISDPSGLFEIHVFFSLHNWSNARMSVYDMHARLYHVSAGYAPLTIGYVSRFRVDLCCDNSILRSNRVFRLDDGDAAHFDLAFETGFYGDTGTALAVFGIDVDFELSGSNEVSKWRIPSDKIYVLQHWGPPYANGTRVHIGEMDAAYIKKRYQEERRKVCFMTESAAAQTGDAAVKYECLGKMLDMHRSRGLHAIDGRATDQPSQ